MTYCMNCGQAKADDAFPFCGGSYCLHEQANPDKEYEPAYELADKENPN